MPQTSDTDTTEKAEASFQTARTSGAATRGMVDDELVAVVRRLVKRAIESPPTGDPHLAGERVLLDVVVDGFRCLLLSARPAVASVHHLSPREQEIVRMVAEGYPNKTIAAVLDISSWTVSTYLRRIFAKLDVRSRSAMVARTLEEGLLTKPMGARPSLRPDDETDEPGSRAKRA